MAVRVLINTGPAPSPSEWEQYDHVVGLSPSELTAQVHHNLDLLGRGRRPLPQPVLTLLVASLGVWVADKLVPRHEATDAWTRHLMLTCPAPTGQQPLAKLASLLDFLTGDKWLLNARQVPAWLPMILRPDPDWQPDCVCLFSGGLDSLVGAIDLLETGRRVLLVSHYDYGQLAGTQKSLADALRQAYGPERVRRWGFRIQFEAPELSLRSRSLLFISLGIAAASVWEEPMPVFMPENGWISLNPPLTGNRLGSYSTRTTHPYFLHGLRQWLAGVGITIPLETPYQFFTKGEMLAQCRRSALLKELAPHTISCAHPVASRWTKGRHGNCGYCYPCLIRRAALKAMGWDEEEHYSVNIQQDREIWKSRTRGRDLRSILYLLQSWGADPNPYRLLWQTGPLPGTGEEQQQLAALVCRGVLEISEWCEPLKSKFDL